MRKLLLKLRRWALYHLTGCADWIRDQDLCEVCRVELIDTVCGSCDRRICGGCNSRYYEDFELCTICRADITPEEEAADRALAASLQDDCPEIEDISWP